jgi:hypothetical protein
MEPINAFYDMTEVRTLDAVHHAEAVALALRYTFIAFTLAVIVFIWRTLSVVETNGRSAAVSDRRFWLTND